MEKHLNASSIGTIKASAGPAKAGHRGGEKFTFLYVAGSAVAVSCAIAYSLFASLAGLQSLFLLIGAVLVACAAVFCALEVRRIVPRAKTENVEAFNERTDPYASRSVDIRSPTGDPYPHHEDYTESAGFDQSQLTARIPGSTPFLDRLENREEKSKVAR